MSPCFRWGCQIVVLGGLPNCEPKGCQKEIYESQRGCQTGIPTGSSDVSPVFYFFFFFFSFLKITQIGKFASSVGPGEEINQLLKELPWGQGGLSLPRSQLCTTLRMLIRLISAEEHLGTAAATVFGTQPWVSPGEGSFPNQRFFLLSFIRWLS